ncbi:MAG TPA: adventurous gliding motility lipoprotein CglC [Anaeromyxobacteraceae bacterium]|nr:adventurous gliding motility lipoprotein CglC [Anaeromyxobacteraceae bacterium]
MSRHLLAALPFAALVGAAACQSVDVGQPCSMQLSYADGGPIAVPVGDGGVYCSAESADFLLTGDYDCAGLVCLQSPDGTCSDQAATPYQVRTFCSKACVSDSDCFNSQTGLVCRRIVLDPSFVASLPDGGAPYLPGALQSSYCAPPSVP